MAGEGGGSFPDERVPRHRSALAGMQRGRPILPVQGGPERCDPSTPALEEANKPLHRETEDSASDHANGHCGTETGAVAT